MLALAVSFLIGADPRALLELSFKAMGGREKLAAVSQVRTQLVGHQFMPEQSERPEGPWFANYYDGTETADFAKGTDSYSLKVHGALFSEPSDQKASYDLASGKREGFAYPTSMPSAVKRMALGPENVLFAASSSLDLQYAGETTLHDVPHDVLTFTYGILPVRLLLNRYTHLPDAVETVDVGQGFWAVWGDVTERTLWGNWDIVPGGLFYPTLWTREYNGLQQESAFLAKVEVDYGPPRDPNFGLTWVPLMRTPARPISFKPMDVAPGIVQFLGGFNCAVVDQGDGLVLLEGVVSSDYVKKIEEDLRTRFPGKKIKAALSTDDAWPHIGGLRQMVAEGVPIYVLPENRRILDRLFQAPHTFMPDDLQTRRRRPVYKNVAEKTSLGQGPNRMEIYPMRGSGTERMLFAYFPESKLLYAPDVIQRSQKEWYSVNLLKQLVEAVDREGLSPTTAFAFHSGPIPFEALRTEVQSQMSR